MSNRSVLFVVFLLLSGRANGQNWANLDAVVYNTKSDTYFFFFGKYFVTKERGQYIDGLPLLITDEWENFPKSWGGGNLDAVCYSPDNDKYYFFKGDEVAETEVTQVPMMLGGTVSIPRQRLSTPRKFNSVGAFNGIPWSRVDAAVYNTETKIYYFFNGDQFVSKKRGEPVDSRIRNVNDADGFVNLAKDRPIRAVDYSGDNKAYYFFWDEFYMTKVQGETIKAGAVPKTFKGSGKGGFEWAERSNNNFVGLANESGYLANFRVTWKSGGKQDSWSKKGVALTYEKRLSLPKDATDITISSHTYDLTTEGNGERVFSESMNIPPNKWYKIYGTVFEPKYKIENKSSNIMGSVSSFFTRDVGNAVENAGQFFEEDFKEAEYQAVKVLASEDMKKRKNLIENFGKSAAAVAKEEAFIRSLFRVAQAKDARVAADAMKSLVNRPEWAEVKKALEFKSMSVGFTSGASAVIGMEGSFGYGVSMNGSLVKGYAGLDGSLGVQSGLGLGCQFGIWKNTPDKLSGNSVAVSVEVGSGVGVSFSIVYDVSLDSGQKPQFSFSGLVVTPGVGAGVGGSVGSGYSWVY
jgi:hypothetical protein